MKNIHKFTFLLLFLCLIFTSGCGVKEDKVELTISAAASLKTSMDMIQTEFEQENSDISLTFNYGGSGTLQRQIEQGAPVDVFLSASEQNYQTLVNQNKLVSESGGAFIKNALVAITSSNHTYLDFKDLLENSTKIAIGTPEAVPAGTYAKEALQHMGVWKHVQEKMVLAKDVSHVVTLVEQESVDGGIVYHSDAVGSDKIKVIEEFDSSLHSEIKYFGAVVQNSKHTKDSAVFIDFLHKPEVQKIFAENGFIPITK